MRAERIKVNNTLLSITLKAVSFLPYFIPFALEGCMVTFLMDKCFHTKQTCFMGNADMVLFEFLLSGFIRWNFSKCIVL